MSRSQTTRRRLLRVVCLCAAAVSGCAHFWNRSCETSPESLSPTGQVLRASAVTITPLCTAAVDDTLLLSFCGELAGALHHAGVLDVTVERLDVHDDCDRPDEWGDVMEPPRSPHGVELQVTIQDLRPYRPMRMAVDVRVIDPESGTTLGRVGDVFFGPTDGMCHAPRGMGRPLRRRRRSVACDGLRGIQANSPRWLIAHVASAVVDRLIFVEPQ